MGSIGNWWVKGFGIRPGEEVRRGFYVNYLRADQRPLGGKLYVTNQRVLFCPHLIDSFFGGSPRMILLKKIVNVAVVDPTEVPDREIVGGGTEKRLRIDTSANQSEYFIINDLEAAVSTINDELESFEA